MGKRIHAFTDDALGNLDATGVAEAIAKKEISVEESIEAAIHRSEKVNPALNAIVMKLYDDARNYELQNKGGIFYGVPTYFKDTDNLKGYPTQMGTGAFTAKVAKRNSRFADQFLSSGVVHLGKTTLPEFGLMCSTENERWAVTRNPWNTDYTPGGSSSGSAALVASGAVPIATGNDGGGSIRIPASICGLVGLKPTRHRIHGVHGTDKMPIEIVHQGVLTRSVRDTAAFYGGMEQFYRNPKLPELGHITEPGKKRLRIAFLQNLPKGSQGWQDPDTSRVQQDTARLLESLGHHVDEIPTPIDVDSMVEYFLDYYGFLSYMSTHWGRMVYKAKVDKSQLEPFTLGLAKRFKKNPFRLRKSVRELRKLGAECSKVFDTYDVVMTPVLSHKTPKIGHFSPQLSYEEVTQRIIDFATYTGLYNITGEPAISLPMGTDSDDMPLGVHLAAPYGQDRRLIELAYELEAAQPWRTLATAGAEEMA